MAYTPQRKKKNNIHKVVLVLAGFSLFVITTLFGLFVLLMNQSFVRMHVIEVKGVSDIGKDKLISETIELMNTRDGWGIPGDNFFLVDTDFLEKEIRTRYSVIDTIKVSKKSSTRLEIDAIERTGVYSFCTDAGVCNLVDPEGVLFKDNNAASSTDALVTFYSAETKKLGDSYLEPAQFKALTIFLDSLISRNLVVNKVWSSQENVVILELISGTKLLVKKSENYDDVYTNIVHLQTIEEFKDITAIDYINLRFGNKVFYCLEGAVCQDNY